MSTCPTTMSRWQQLGISDKASLLTEMFRPATPMGENLLIALVVLVVMMVASVVVALTVLLRMPVDYFVVQKHAVPRAPRGVLVCTGVILRNLLGVVLLASGVVLSVPGVPGQGMLTILAGLLLLDFPGKRRLLVKLCGRPRVLRSINCLRAKCSRQPLVIG